jgi:hypothetical protein
MEHCFYNCSKEYINSIDLNLYKDLVGSINSLSKHETQAGINNDILIDLSNKGWSFDTAPVNN